MLKSTDELFREILAEKEHISNTLSALEIELDKLIEFLRNE